MRRLNIAAILAASTARADMEWQTAVGQRDQVTRGLVAYWAMRNSGTTVYDEYGSYNGTAVNSPTFDTTHAAVGYGASFTGGSTNTTRIQVAHNTAHWIGKSGTVSVWVKTSDSGAFRRIATKYNFGIPGDDVGALRGWSLGISVGIVQGVIGDSAGANVATPASAHADGAWHHIVMTYDGTNIRLYVDAVLVDTEPCTKTPTQTTEPLGIGGSNEPVNHLAGQIDELRLFNVVLTADEVKQLFRMGAIPKGIK